MQGITVKAAVLIKSSSVKNVRQLRYAKNTLRNGTSAHPNSAASRSLTVGARGAYPIVSIIGSGPAGFGVAQYLLKNHDTVQVNIIEKRPVPYGLVRYGVSPDHQDVKNCINGYEKVSDNPRFSFYGGVEIGRDISLNEVSTTCDVTVLCHGAQEYVKLGIEGESLRNVITSKEFVGWYNGESGFENLNPNLSGKTAVIIGVGNVALDCARMILKRTNELKNTDITRHSFKQLEESKIENVILVGRRGPLQMACTRKELAEIVELGYVKTSVSPSYFTEEIKQALDIRSLKLRKMQRMVKYLIKSCKSQGESVALSKKHFNIKLLRTPIQFLGADSVCSVLLEKNSMHGNDPFHPNLKSTGEFEEIPCSLVITAIGYGMKTLEKSVSITGKVDAGHGPVNCPYRLYACGWCRSGPKGVLADTLNDCLVTAGQIIKDIKSPSWEDVDYKQSFCSLLKLKKIDYFSWNHWKVIDNYEIVSGAKLGKVREKLIQYDDMANVAFNSKYVI